MVRSTNAVPIVIGVVGRTERLTSVVYDGPVVDGAWLAWRGRFRCLLVNVSAAERVGVAVSRLSSGKFNVLVAMPAVVIGQTIELSGLMLVDLIPGDQIELQVGGGFADVWQLEPFGFSVDVR